MIVQLSRPTPVGRGSNYRRNPERTALVGWKARNSVGAVDREMESL